MSVHQGTDLPGLLWEPPRESREAWLTEGMGCSPQKPEEGWAFSRKSALPSKKEPAVLG